MRSGGITTVQLEVQSFEPCSKFNIFGWEQNLVTIDSEVYPLPARMNYILSNYIIKRGKVDQLWKHSTVIDRPVSNIFMVHESLSRVNIIQISQYQYNFKEFSSCFCIRDVMISPTSKSESSSYLSKKVTNSEEL